MILAPSRHSISHIHLKIGRTAYAKNSRLFVHCWSGIVFEYFPNFLEIFYFSNKEQTLCYPSGRKGYVQKIVWNLIQIEMLNGEKEIESTFWIERKSFVKVFYVYRSNGSLQRKIVSRWMSAWGRCAHLIGFCIVLNWYDEGDLGEVLKCVFCVFETRSRIVSRAWRRTV